MLFSSGVDADAGRCSGFDFRDITRDWTLCNCCFCLLCLAISAIYYLNWEKVSMAFFCKLISMSCSACIALERIVFYNDFDY